MKKRVAGLVLTTLLGGVFFTALAEKENTDGSDYQLDPIIVSATRSEKIDLNTPMSTTVITGEELQKQGAQNLHSALAMVTGVNYKQFGPGGAAMGTMSNEVTMRGIKNGTLVMVNGSPITLRGKYYLDAIPAERIERVEIIKGGGSVLYGSEAMAGVINIITKDEGDNSISIGVGNFDQRLYDVSLGDKKFSFAAHKERWGRVNHVNTLDNYRYADATFAKKQSLHAGVKLTDNLNFSYNYFNSKVGYENFFSAVKPTGTAQVGDVQQSRVYNSKQHLLELNYIKDDIEVRTYFNQLNIEYEGPNYFDASTHKPPAASRRYTKAKERNRSYGVDFQKTWWISDNTTVIAGTTYQNEYYDKSVFVKGDERDRHNFAVYGQVEHRLNKKNTIILSGRETWNTGARNNFSNFSAAGQYIHSLNDNENVYVNVSQSFIMPTFAQIYGASETALPNPGLRPQKGINYELGYKKKHDRHSYKVALYHTRITDNIKVTLQKTNGVLDHYTYINSDFRNTGLEAEMAYKGENGWGYRLGMNIQNPKGKESGDNPKKPYWDREFGRFQLTGGITYENGPWTSTITASYLGERVGAPSSEHSFPIKPYLLTSWNTTYRFNDASSISLRIDNVLDREDIVSNSGSDYRSTPLNFLLTYRHQF